MEIRLRSYSVPTSESAAVGNFAILFSLDKKRTIHIVPVILKDAVVVDSSELLLSSDSENSAAWMDFLVSGKKLSCG